MVLKTSLTASDSADPLIGLKIGLFRGEQEVFWPVALTRRASACRALSWLPLIALTTESVEVRVTKFSFGILNGPKARENQWS